MIALDICEPDDIDGGLMGATPTTVTPTPVPTPKAETVAPAPTTEKPLTDGDGQASELQIKQMKEILKKLMEADPSKEEMVAEIAVKTDGFATISKKDCENIIVEANKMLKKGDK